MIRFSERKAQDMNAKSYDVLAIGELNVDLVLTGMEGLPELGRERIAQGCSLLLGSSTAIFACGVARFGFRTKFHSVVGDDEFGRVALRNLESAGVDIRDVQIDPARNTGITVSLNTAGDRAMATFLGTIDAVTYSAIPQGLIGSARHLHVGSFFLQRKLRPDLPRLFAEAHHAGMTTSLDSGWDDTENWDYGIREVLQHTDLFFPNELEASRISRQTSARDAALDLARFARTVIVKCGPSGAVAASGTDVLSVPAFTHLIAVDTTGAGDSFNAGYIAAFLDGRGPKECLLYGNACGSISVTRIGGAGSCATREEVEELLAI
jgi:sugar/nucleoside kinase (ribokinase family)